MDISAHDSPPIDSPDLSPVEGDDDDRALVREECLAVVEEEVRARLAVRQACCSHSLCVALALSLSLSLTTSLSLSLSLP